MFAQYPKTMTEKLFSFQSGWRNESTCRRYCQFVKSKIKILNQFAQLRWKYWRVCVSASVCVAHHPSFHLIRILWLVLWWHLITFIYAHNAERKASCSSCFHRWKEFIFIHCVVLVDCRHVSLAWCHRSIALWCRTYVCCCCRCCVCCHSNFNCTIWIRQWNMLHKYVSAL